MSQKDLAFELFDQGKPKDAPEMKALGLKKGTLNKYYILWEKGQPASSPFPAVPVIIHGKLEEELSFPKVSEVPPEVPEVPPEKIPVTARLDSLNTASLFELNGEKYRIGEKTPECIVCHRLNFRNEGPLETDKMWMVVGQVSLAIYTMVKPIK